MAAEDLDDGEVAVWVPSRLVLSENTVDSAIKRSVDQTLKAVMQESPLSNAEASVYRTMGCLVAGFLLERSRGPSSIP